MLQGLSMASRGGGITQLPVEIWQQIAGHMSSKAWARLSRTCKAMHSVQPEQISIGVRSESALAWVQTHWGQASSLRLVWLTRDIPWVMAHNAASVTSLERLELRLLQERSPTTAMLLTWLLAQASQLQLLFLEHPTALVVPPIRNLSHLIMASSEFTPSSAASIRQLRNLQTLWLGIKGPLPFVACAEFDLGSLPQLSEVCVDSLPMPGITSPRHCRLHLVGDQDDMFLLETWSEIARQGQLQSVNVRSDGLVYPEPFLDQIPFFLLESNCSFLYWWDIAQLGKLSNPALFDAARFCCLTHLNLKGRDIHIVLSQELLLQVLHMQARYMSIGCVNPLEQAKSLQQLRIVYRSLQDTDIFVLVGAMCGMGAMVSKVGGVEDIADADEYNGFLVNSQHVPGVWKCPCGACLDCLQQT
ncbi:hypothetical protein COCOBI_14-4220 [Coccomyxa sp. Obi]|nr:hypothetical protein COCOBI_14-4220 [Coccomyxa sp. Obi]